MSYDDAAVAVYYVTWTVGRPDHGADFDLLIGRWGEGSAPEQRFLVSLRFRTAPDGGFMVIDGEAGKYTMCSRALARGEVVGTPLAQEVFDLVDAIWLQDQRLEEIRAAGS